MKRSSVEPMRRSMGMTLVELMVSLCILAIVMVAVVGIFGAQYRNMGRDHGIKEAVREGRISFEFLRLDLMEAGWSVLPEMSFYLEDGGTGRSDKIYINDTALIDIDEDEHMDQLISERCSGCSRIEAGSGTSSVTVNDLNPNNDLDEDGDPKNDFVGKAYQFVISDDGVSKIARIVSVSDTDNQLNLENAVSGTWLAPAVYYCVDDGNADCHPDSSTDPLWVLRRSDRSSGGRQVVAENVVDLQVAYRDADGKYWYGEAGCDGSGTGPGKCQMSPFDPRSIDLVRLTLVVRSRHQSRDLLGDPRYCRPAVENHAAGIGADECGRVYRVFSMMIHPRNNRE